MLDKWNEAKKKTDPAKLKEELALCKEKLGEQQLLIKQNKLPVIVLIEGWAAAGKGSLTAKVIEALDPRFFHVISTANPTEEEQRKPFLWRHFVRIPESGKFLFLDSGWMTESVHAQLSGHFSTAEYTERLKSINTFERQLTDNGYLLVKVFLHIDRKEQEKRIETLQSHSDTAWRVSKADSWQNRHYKTCKTAFSHYLTATNMPSAPWHILNGSRKKEAELALCTLLTESIAMGIAAKSSGVATALPQKTFALAPVPLLSQVALDQELCDEAYEGRLKRAQRRLEQLHNEIYRKKIPVIIAYEGWDAAGKGGNIKRISSALDPRGYQVIPIASPEPHELAHHYLWRFWNQLPKTGHIVIFDRSWYGRVMVERVEGFCSETDWLRAYTEINEFEQELTDWGAVVLKFWIQIDKDTQLARFTDRQNTPDKSWKLTDEDWRNREKWDEYEIAIDDMLQKTSTQNAPWHIIESVDKKYARIKTLELLIEALEVAMRK